MQHNLPPNWWQRKSKEVNWLMARFPRQSNSANKPTDGDMPRPLEIASGGAVSRRQIDRELYYFVSCGTPVLVHDIKARGSSLPHDLGEGCKSQWMIGNGMFREQPLFWNPRTNAIVKNKSYTAFTLRRGMNFTQLIGVQMPKASAKTRPLPSDFSEKITITLPEMNNNTVEGRQHLEGDPINLITHVNVDPKNAPTVTQTGQQQGKQGSVNLQNSEGNPLKVDQTNGLIIPADAEEGRHVQELAKVTKPWRLSWKLIFLVSV
jgi:hypothetical protein